MLTPRDWLEDAEVSLLETQQALAKIRAAFAYTEPAENEAIERVQNRLDKAQDALKALRIQWGTPL